MKIISTTHCYSMSVDKEKNRIYITMSDFLRDNMDSFTYLFDIKTISQEISKDFTLLADWTNIKQPPPNADDFDGEAKAILCAAGLRKSAEIVPKSFLDLYVSRSGVNGNANGTHSKLFDDRTAAEAWLDKE